MIFNEEQIEAINHGTGPALVLAGPGSGKTAVITGRTLRLVREKKAKPEEILVITFTKAAAEEMKQRYLKEASYSESGVCFGTFHAVFFHILREGRGLQNNALIKTSEQYRIIYALLSEKNPGRAYSKEDVRRILGEISRRKSRGKVMESSGLPCSPEEFGRIYEAYQRILKSEGRIDFDDILLDCFELLKEKGEIREGWQKRFKYLLLDEFQDINLLQYETVRLLAAPENNLFAVGDDDQSIYAFRGAEPGLLDRFLQDYPRTHTVTLGKNYRSAPSISRAANAVIKNNLSHRRKDISNLPKKGFVKLLEYDDRREEYQKLSELVKSSSFKPCEIAVLYRTNSITRGLAEVFEKAGIPFVLREDVPDLLSHHITRDILAYLKLAAGSRDRKEYLRICNHPYRGINRNFFPEELVSRTEALRLLKQAERYRLLALFEDIDKLSDLDPYGAMFMLRRMLGYEDYLAEYAEKNSISKEELLEVLEELQENAEGVKTVAEFEEKLKKTYAEHVKGREQRELSGVQLMTFHASKGLEFKQVFLVDLNEGIAPLKHAKSSEAVEEERRVVYVAMTRAEEELYLMHVKKRGGRFVQPSRFVLEAKNDYAARLDAALS